MAKSNPHSGSHFDDFLKREGIYDEVQARALTRALAEQIEESMKAASLTKSAILSSGFARQSQFTTRASLKIHYH